MSQSLDSVHRGDDGLFDRAKAGDQAAWEELVRKCDEKVRRVIRQHLRTWGEMRSLYDSADFTSDVWKSLFVKSARFDFPNVDALTAFLRKAATQKLIDAARRMHTQKFQSDRERRLEAMLGHDEGNVDLASPGPTPSQIVAADESRERILAKADSDQERILIDRKLQGDSNQEAAAHSGLPLRKVQRSLEKLHDWWNVRGAGGRK